MIFFVFLYWELLCLKFILKLHSFISFQFVFFSVSALWKSGIYFARLNANRHEYFYKKVSLINYVQRLDRFSMDGAIRKAKSNVCQLLLPSERNLKLVTKDRKMFVCWLSWLVVHSLTRNWTERFLQKRSTVRRVASWRQNLEFKTRDKYVLLIKLLKSHSQNL